MTLLKLLVVYVQALIIGAFTYAIVERIFQSAHQ